MAPNSRAEKNEDMNRAMFNALSRLTWRHARRNSTEKIRVDFRNPVVSLRKVRPTAATTGIGPRVLVLFAALTAIVVVWEEEEEEEAGVATNRASCE